MRDLVLRDTGEVVADGLLQLDPPLAEGARDGVSGIETSPTQTPTLTTVPTIDSTATSLLENGSGPFRTIEPSLMEQLINRISHPLYSFT